MKQTAVEWLYEKVWKDLNFSISSSILDQAKEIEKQQIIDAYLEGDADSYYYKDNRDRMGEDYYNETFDIKEIE